ncbi:Aminomethyltransferase [Streptomyces badius]
MGEITVPGPEAAAFLSYALVGNIATVGNGRARYTMIVQEDGGIVDDLQAGLHPNPVPHAHVVTTTTHQTLGGPRGRRDPLHPGARQDDQRGGLPGSAGRSAGARDRGEGGLVQGAAGEGSRSASSAPWTAPGSWPQRLVEPAHRGGRLRPLRRHRRAPGPGRPAQLRAGRPAGRRTGSTSWASRSTGTPFRTTRVPRWSPRACGSAPRHWPRAASAAEDFAEVAEIIASALKPSSTRTT